MNPNSIDSDIWTLIAVLGEERHKKFWGTRAAEIQKLLIKGADPNAGRGSPLTNAVRMGHLEIVKILLEFGADIHGGCAYRTPLVFAANHPEIKAHLLKHGAKETIFTAAAHGDLGKIRSYVKKDPSLVHLTDEEDMTPLFFTASRHDLAGMRFLLEAGAGPNAVATKSYGVTPIHLACRLAPEESARDAISLLVKYNTDLDAQNKGGVTALHMAVRDRNVEAVRSLLENRADPDIEDRGRKSTPLRRAVTNTGRPGTSGKTDKAIEIVKLLLAAGADPNHVNRSGKHIIESTRNDVIRALLKEAMG